MQSLCVVQQPLGPTTCRCSDEQQKFLVCNCVQHKNCPTLHCDLCNYNTDIGNIMKHFESVKHSDRYRKLMQDLYLTHLPPPTAAHYRRMSASVTNLVKRSELTNEDIHNRQLSLQRFNEILQRIEPNCTIRVYGSTINGFGLKHSNVNIELARQGEETAESSGQLLRRISEVISQFQRFDFQYTEIVDDFDLKVPRLNFVELTKDRQYTRRLKFELSVTAEKSWKSSTLFNFYAKFDERARILGIALRLWARAFKLDNQENGTWPPIAFVVLVIHYLQRTEPPVLPCFHELQDKTSPKSTEGKELKENSEEEAHHELADADIAAFKHTWEVKNKKSVGELWIGLFRYYIYDFQCGTHVVSIRKTTKFDTHGNKGWGTKILAIEDPTRPSCNLSRSVGNIKIYHFFTEVWRDTYKYLMTPHTSSGAFFSQRDFELSVRPVLSRLQLLSLRVENFKALKDAAKSDDQSEENDHESSDEDSNTQQQAYVES
ncbi:terminal uridylyltransferase 4-like protein [Leptotrombidium deliense]|uniref:Terminal uridylyltransferase 4-like protein n=1 Tax=Leptotrombidium deliense TaxID=299467 RepID=A0A443S6I9_9ACAR|nr:terminal uridylyltransferase 4-like protein [Leptotrombidium deliense]